MLSTGPRAGHAGAGAADETPARYRSGSFDDGEAETITLHRRALLAGTAAVLTGTEARAQQPSIRLPVRPQTGDVVQPLPKSAPGSDLEVIDLWPDLPPGGGGPFRSEYRFDETLTGVITGVVRPCLLVIRPEKPNGAGIVIAAGGGYLRIDIGNEGLPVGQWLARAGITAFVLVYRLPSEEWRDGLDAPRQDAQRAMRLVRWRAEDYGLDPDRIGVLGFSAGGHLMGVTATDAEQDLYDDADEADGLSARPSFAGLIYPIITMRAPFDRTMSSRRVLVGDYPRGGGPTRWRSKSTRARPRSSWFRPPTTGSRSPTTRPPCTRPCGRRRCRPRCTCSSAAAMASGSACRAVPRRLGPPCSWPGCAATAC